MKQEDKLRTAAALSSLWDGEAIRRVRAGDGSVVMPGRRAALHLMAQPAVADIWFRDHLLTDQGLLSRMLVSAPDTAAGTRFQRDERPETDIALKRYGARLLGILETPLPLVPGKTNELAPRPLPLSPQARAFWSAFADHVERAKHFTAGSAAAIARCTRRYRQRKRDGVVSVSFVVRADALNRLVRLGLLRDDNRSDREAVRRAVVDLAGFALKLPAFQLETLTRAARLREGVSSSS